MSEPLKAKLPTGGTKLALATGNDELVYVIPDGHNRLLVQLDLAEGTGWTATAAVTAQAGITLAKQYAFSTPITYTSVGLKDTIELSGATHFRLYVSTAAAGSDVIAPVVKTWRETP